MPKWGDLKRLFIDVGNAQATRIFKLIPSDLRRAKQLEAERRAIDREVGNQ